MGENSDLSSCCWYQIAALWAAQCYALLKITDCHNQSEDWFRNDTAFGFLFCCKWRKDVSYQRFSCLIRQ